MLSKQEKLERSYRRSIRFLEDEVCFLRDCLWQETQGRHEIFNIPIQTPRAEETVGKTDVDSFVRSLLTD